MVKNNRKKRALWGDAQRLSKELESLSTSIPGAMREEAWRVLDQISCDAPIAWEGADFLQEVLLPLIPYVPTAYVKQLWNRALDEFAGNTTIGVSQHGYNLAAIVPYLPPDKVVMSIKALDPGVESFDTRPKSEFLIVLAQHSSSNDQNDAYKEAWNCAIQSLDGNKLIRSREFPAEQSWLNEIAQKLPPRIAGILWKDSMGLLRDVSHSELLENKSLQKMARCGFRSLALSIPTDMISDAIDDCIAAKNISQRADTIALLVRRMGADSEKALEFVIERFLENN